ncbi:MAG: transporter substrate-binding domain-containing protein [Lachnospiraceae bacterium]|nr:transporter substrate-binding domain-containing protein [Lachnospiraceae bacterium]MDD3616248.1 transporter substrate-binding domain-containing protein [Lachnospiraceae bacterium]
MVNIEGMKIKMKKVVSLKKNKGLLLIQILCAVLTFILTMPFFMTRISGAEYGARKTVRVGFFPFDGYHMEDADGVKSGYGYDILHDMMIYENWNYEYVGYEDEISWDEAQDMLASGEIDLLTSATMTEERKKIFDYSDQPIGESSTLLTVKGGDNRYDTSDYSNWNGIRVGMLTNNSRNDSFDQYAEEHAFTYTKVEYDTPAELQESLNFNNIDMIVTSNLLKLDNVWTVDQFDEKPFYVIVKKGNEELLSQVNDALKKMQESNASFATELYQTYYSPDSGGVVSFSREEQNYINTCNEEGKVFQALMNPDRKPLSYNEDEKIQGLLTDICKEVFDRTGLSIEFVDAKNRDEYVQMLEAGDKSILCDFTGTIGAAENKGYVRTNAYYNSSTSKLVQKGYSGNGNRCALTKSSITNKRLANQPGIDYTFYDTMEQCKDAVLDGDVDFSYGYTRTVQEMVYADVTNSLACIPVTNMSIDFFMGVNIKESSLLTSIIKKSLDSISEEDISYISEPYTYYDRTQTSLIGLIYEQPVFLLAVVVIIFVIILGVVLIVINKKKHEEEIETNKKLSTALASAEKANQAKTEFLSRMSHDIRTPMNAIIGMTELAKDEDEADNVKEYLKDIDDSSHFLLGLINDILDLSKIESGALSLKPEPYYLGEMRKHISSVIEPLMKEKHIEYVERVPAEPICILADPLRLKQIVFNLLSNSAKFTPEGGFVELMVEAQELENEQYKILIRVRDSGIGISEEFLPHIFDSFAQERTNMNATVQGTGLGLSIVKKLVEKMNGTIEVKSKLGEGTEFMVEVVFQKAKAKETAEKDTVNMVNLQGKRILLVEDNELNVIVADRLLKKKGCLVEVAANGVEAVAKFGQSEENFFDAILMDIRMPVMDGLEATEKIRRLNRKDAQTIPIIAMTAEAFSEEKKRTIGAGMNYHLSKPIEPAKLYEALGRYIRD